MKRQSPFLQKRLEIEARLASEHAQQAQVLDMQNYTAYQKMQMQLGTHKRLLANIKSRELATLKKAELLKDYKGYIDGVLAVDNNAQDDVLMTLMVWFFDTDNIARGLDIARYAIKNNVQMPEQFVRDVKTALIDFVADAAIINTAATTLEQLQEVETLTAGADIDDRVRAKLHRALGENLSTKYNCADAAIKHLRRAAELDNACGCKKLLDKLARQKQALAKPKAAKTPPPRARH